MDKVGVEKFNELEEFVRNKTTVCLQVKDLEPTVNTHNLNRDKFIKGQLRQSRGDPTFSFFEHGKSGQDVLLTSLVNIIEGSCSKGKSPLSNHVITSITPIPKVNMNGNRIGGRRRTRRNRRRRTHRRSSHRNRRR